MWCSLLSGDGIIDILGSPVPWAHPRNSLGSSAEFPGLERSQEPSCSHRTFLMRFWRTKVTGLSPR